MIRFSFSDTQMGDVSSAPLLDFPFAHPELLLIEFIYRLVLELGSKYIAAGAVHCAGFPTEDNLEVNPVVGDAVPILIMNATDDPLNPYDGASPSQLPLLLSFIGANPCHHRG